DGKQVISVREESLSGCYRRNSHGTPNTRPLRAFFEKKAPPKRGITYAHLLHQVHGAGCLPVNPVMTRQDPQHASCRFTPYQLTVINRPSAQGDSPCMIIKNRKQKNINNTAIKRTIHTNTVSHTAINHCMIKMLFFFDFIMYFYATIVLKSIVKNSFCLPIMVRHTPYHINNQS
ncbi:hypothetical protein OSL46_25270, partial [Escherichia coli]|nr:hypothetical protein [Escherichia coli]